MLAVGAVLALSLSPLSPAPAATADRHTGQGPLALTTDDPVAKAGPGTTAVWRLTVENRGNATRNVTFDAGADLASLGARFDPAEVDLAPDASADVAFRLPLPDSGGLLREIGNDFTVRVTAEDADDPSVQATRDLTLRLTAPDLGFRLLPQGMLATVALALIPAILGYGLLVKQMSPTLVIAATILALFFVQIFADSRALQGAMDPVMRELALRPYHFVQGWQWWAPLTHMFMHGGLTHILGNLIILVLVGPRLEMHMSERTYTALYFLSGLGAAGATLLLFFDDVPFGLIPNVGASGAIYGVLAAFAMRLPKERIPIPIGILIFIPAYIAFPLYVLYNIFLSFGGTNVAWWAHLAGAAVGAVFAYFWEPDEPEPYAWEQGAGWEPGW